MEGKQTQCLRTSPKYDIKRPPDRFTDEHKQAFVSKHNFSLMTSWTSVQPSLLTYFQALRICLFPPSRRRYGKSERRNSAAQREWNMSCRSSLAPATRCPHSEDPPHGPAIFIWEQSGHMQPAQHVYPALQTSVRPYLRYLPYLQFASRFGFTPLILSEKAGEEMAWGNSRDEEKGGKSGSEDSDRSEGSCPSRIPYIALTSSPRVEGTVSSGPLRGLRIGPLFTVPARSYIFVYIYIFIYIYYF